MNSCCVKLLQQEEWSQRRKSPHDGFQPPLVKTTNIWSPWRCQIWHQDYNHFKTLIKYDHISSSQHAKFYCQIDFKPNFKGIQFVLQSTASCIFKEKQIPAFSCFRPDDTVNAVAHTHYQRTP